MNIFVDGSGSECGCGILDVGKYVEKVREGLLGFVFVFVRGMVI